MRENETTEFKQNWTKDCRKEVVAFANTEGGTILVGVTDDGVPIGLQDADQSYSAITNSIRDSIEPDVTMFVRPQLLDNNVVRLDVSEGSAKPYYLKEKGMTPSGVYVRQGTSKAPASSEQIRQMIKESDGDVFDQTRSPVQDLTFGEAASSFENAGLEFGPEEYPRLGMTQASSGLYTNTALLLSDQCPYTTKVAVLQDNDSLDIAHAQEFGGSLFAQLREAQNFLSNYNYTYWKFGALRRTERANYDDDALREAIVNAIVHREYSLSASIMINLKRSEVTVLSPGGLPAGLDIADIGTGLSYPRNRTLAEIFYRLRLIESYGTGIPRIRNTYKGLAVQPQIETTPNTFKLILPNRNSEELDLPQHIPASSKNTTNTPATTVDSHIESEPADNPEIAHEPTPASLSPDVQRVLEWLRDNESIDASQIMTLLNRGRTMAFRVLKNMRSQGLIAPVAGQRGRYRKAQTQSR